MSTNTLKILRKSGEQSGKFLRLVFKINGFSKFGNAYHAMLKKNQFEINLLTWWKVKRE